MSRFYITLPSNSSSEYYPNNTVTRYTTKLADKIELEGDWEVGLAEISVPSEVQNVVRGQYYYSIYVNDVHIRTIDLPSRHHERIRTLVDAMHVEQRKQVLLQTHEPLLVEFSYFDSKISIKLHQHPNFYYVFQFSRDLARMLGLDEDVKYSSIHTI